MGSSCAWQSVMCSSETLPNFGSSYKASSALAASASACRPSAMPATDAQASACANSRRERCMRAELLVDRRLRVEQQRHHMLQLLFIEQLLVAEARHVGAGRVGLGIPQLAPG